MKATIFDFDGVFTENSSGDKFREHLVREGLFAQQSMAKIRKAVEQYQNNEISYNRANQQVGQAWLKGIKGQKHSRYQQEAEKFLQEFNYDQETGRQVIDHFKRKGYRTIIISSSPIEIIRIAVQELGADQAVAGKSEVKDGRYTGQFEIDLAGRRAKADYLQHNLEEVELEESYGFGDSPQDAEFLELVGKPIVINPSRKMEKIAAERGWNTYPSLEVYWRVIAE